MTTPPSSARTSSPNPFPSPSPSSSYSHYTSNNSSNHQQQYTPSRPNSNNNKRKQVKNACVNCQKACKKCDDQRPCSRCVKYGIEDGCINSQRKERKRKHHPHQNHQDDSNIVTTNTRIHLNLSSTRSRAVEGPVPMRLSSRNGIRPFPKELLESLQHEEYSQNHEEGEGEGDEDGTFRDHNKCGQHYCHHQDHDESNFMELSRKVTDEFKILAKICSDLHSVLNPHQLPAGHIPPYYHHHHHHRQINPFMMIPDQHQRYQNSLFNVSSFEYEVPRVPSTPPVILQNRSISPSQLHQMSLIINQQQQHHQQQQHPIPHEQQVVLRNLMNRTPPEEQDSFPTDFSKQA